MRPGHRAYDIEGVEHVRNPIQQRLVHGVLQGSASGTHGIYLGSEELHPENVRALAFYVVNTHIHLAVKPEHGRYGSGSDTVLTRACFGYDPSLFHPLREKGLAYGVVYLMSSGMAEVFPLKIYPGPADVFRKPLGMVKRGRPAYVILEIVG